MRLGLSPAPSSLKGEPELRAGVKGLAGGRDPESRVRGGDEQSEAGNVEKPRQDGGRERGRLGLIPTGDPAGVVGRAPRNCPPGGHAWAVLTAGSFLPGRAGVRQAWTAVLTCTHPGKQRQQTPGAEGELGTAVMGPSAHTCAQPVATATARVK